MSSTLAASTRDGASPVARTAIPFIAALSCLGCILLLICATVVLALIPVYLPSKSVPINSGAFRSKEVTLIADVNRSPANGGRRRRDTFNADDFINGTFGDAGMELVRRKIESGLSSPRIRGVQMISVTLAYRDTYFSRKKRKRFALSKRATTRIVVIVIKFYVLFTFDCAYTCQLTVGRILRDQLYKISLSDFIFTNVQIFKNGLYYKDASAIQITLIEFVSEILPGLSQSSATVGNATTTVAPVTPLIG